LLYPLYLQIVGQGSILLWAGFGVYVVVLSLFMGIWCRVFGSVDVEEYGRGGSIQLFRVLMVMFRWIK